MKAFHCNFLILLNILLIFQELVIFVISMILMSLVLRNRDLRKRMGEVVDILGSLRHV